VVEPGSSAALASQLLGRDLLGERPVTVDQTNESVIVADEVVVKWLRPPVPAPHPGVEMLSYLTARDFPDMPEFLGAHGDDDLVYAILTQYLPGAQDGWDWYVDDVDAWLHGNVRFEALIRSAQRMGQLTAELHRTLHGFRGSVVAARTYHVKAMHSLDLALRLVDGEEGERLRDLEPQVRDALGALRNDRMLAAHRIHGDLHVGNFLRSGYLLMISDFDGNPMSEPTDRRLPQTPLVDLASMLQSIDHVGRVVVQRRHPGRQLEVEQFIGSAIAAALQAYTQHHQVDHDLLHALCVAQELHEYGYAFAHLPHWRYVPDTALPAVLARR
jgi:maltokinase